jgi:hypothetical protein
MPTLPEIRIPMPEEEQPLTLYGRITNTNEPPKYDDIQNSNLPKEEKIRQIQYRTKAYQDDLDRQLHKDYARMGAGTALSAASFHPFFNIPYVGTGIGGAMYDLGQGIVEGDTAGDLAKRAGRGFVIGETIGAIPYVGKALGKTKAEQAVINSAPVQAVGNVLNKAGEKFANTKLYDALMTDIKAFNPNKQTMYHGSPYDFNKFSNEAIGTGEGAQAHGYGHYAALNKDVAEEYASRLSKNPLANEEYLNSTELKNLSDSTKQNLGLWDKDFTEQMLKEDLSYSRNWLEEQRLKGKLTPEQESGTLATIDKYQKDLDLLNNFDDSNLISDKQLYKLSVPKDDVMLREDLPFSEQPKAVQEALKNIAKENPNYKLFNQYLNLNKTGKDLYEYLRSDLDYPNIWQDNILETMGNTPQKVSNILSQKGIKGISYNGGIDGEARVIFNPNDIVIGRKYINQPNLYQQLTGKQNTGALVDALFNR